MLREIVHLPLAERAAALRLPARKSRIFSERSERLAGDGTPIPPLVDLLLADIERIAARMFALDAGFNYGPDLRESFFVRAKTAGTSALEALYDSLSQGDGSKCISHLQLQPGLA